MADWKDGLPEALRADPSLKDIADVGSLAKNFIETKAFVGNSIRPVNKDAGEAPYKEFLGKLQKHAPELMMVSDDEAAQTALWAKLGRPDKPEKYAFTVPEGVEIPLEGLRATAAEAGMTQKQFEKMANRAVEGVKRQSDDFNQDQTALKKEWGGAYDSKLKNIAGMASKAGADDKMVAQILAGKMPSGNLKFLDKLAAAIGPGEGTDMGKQGGGANRVTPNEAQAQADEIMANPAYFNNQHADHKRLVAKYADLMKIVYPD